MAGVDSQSAVRSLFAYGTSLSHTGGTVMLVLSDLLDCSFAKLSSSLIFRWVRLVQDLEDCTLLSANGGCEIPHRRAKLFPSTERQTRDVSDTHINRAHLL